MDHVTPSGARVEPPPVITVERRPALPRWLPELACPLLWAIAVLLMVNLGYQLWQAAAEKDRQIAWADRV